VREADGKAKGNALDGMGLQVGDVPCEFEIRGMVDERDEVLECDDDIDELLSVLREDGRVGRETREKRRSSEGL